MKAFLKKFALFVERHPTLYKGFLIVENLIKKPVFNCQSCGQCVLSHNAFTCAMRCPKQLRNGPCGGTRPDGTCEVYPERPCIWHLIYERSVKLGREEKLLKYHVPVDRRLEKKSAILNMWAGRIEGMSMSRKLKEGDDKPKSHAPAER
ncbi:MAG TPA: methylenetetrahydrofolate reductase C-terminal domain-containing protein [Fimbriimonas sp.]